MAESNNNKRNSVAGKIATPKTGGGGNSPAMQPLADPLENLGKAIGAKVRLTTAAPHSQTYEGSLYTADPILNIVAINTRSSSASAVGDYHIVPVSRIQNFQVLSLAPHDGSLTTAQPAIGPIDTKQLKQREETRIRTLREEEQDRGKGVSKEGQAIFDALKRINIQVRWHNTEIVADDKVLICSPYRPEDCKGRQEEPGNVTRIKRIVEGERKKLKEKEDRERKAATPTGPRKGG